MSTTYEIQQISEIELSIKHRTDALNPTNIF